MIGIYGLVLHLDHWTEVGPPALYVALPQHVHHGRVNGRAHGDDGDDGGHRLHLMLSERLTIFRLTIRHT